MTTVAAENSVADLAFHDLANIFPLLPDNELGDLADDIKRNGQIEPIVLYDDKILDGRNRYRACRQADVEPRFIQYAGDNPIAFVVSANLRRRHLTESQRAMVAAELADMARGNPNFSNSANLQNSVSRAQAADMLNVSERSVNSAKKIHNEGVSELVDAVKQGKISVSKGAKVLSFDSAKQRDIATQPNKKEATAAANHALKKQGKIDIGKMLGADPPEISKKYSPFVKWMALICEELGDTDPKKAAREFHDAFPYDKKYWTEKMESVLKPSGIFMTELHRIWRKEHGKRS